MASKYDYLKPEIQELLLYHSVRETSKIVAEKYEFSPESIRSHIRTGDYDLISKIKNIADNNQVPIKNIKHGWLKTEQESIFFTNPDYEGILSYDQVRDEIIKEMSLYSPVFPEIKRERKASDNHLLVISPADIHIGKLSSAFETGEEYNQQIAVNRVREGVMGILGRVANENINQILFIGGNDALHVDTPRSTTTAGTVQDTCGMWYDNFRIARKLYIEILEMCLSVAPVHFMNCLSNHDFMTSFFLSDIIATWFRKCKDITFDVDMKHRKYFYYGNNIIGATHGDGAKMDKLPLLMANESKEWSSVKNRYIYIHHGHRKKSDDFPGVTVEMLRSPSSADGWHHRNGYQHNPKAIEGFLHHHQYGQISRLTHLF